MRYIVKYRKPEQIEGARLFDIHKDADQEAVRLAAERTAGVNAEIIEVVPNDGTVPYEKEVGA